MLIHNWKQSKKTLPQIMKTSSFKNKINYLLLYLSKKNTTHNLSCKHVFSQILQKILSGKKPAKMYEPAGEGYEVPRGLREVIPNQTGYAPYREFTVHTGGVISTLQVRLKIFFLCLQCILNMK